MLTMNQFLCAVQTEQLMELGVKFGFTWKRTHWSTFCRV